MTWHRVIVQRYWQERSNSLLSNSYEKIHFLRDFLFEVERFLLLVDRRDTCVFFFFLYTSILLFFLSPFHERCNERINLRGIYRLHYAFLVQKTVLQVRSCCISSTTTTAITTSSSSSSPLSPPSPHPPPRFLLPLC